MPECSDALAQGAVSEATLKQYLGMIEQRTNELLQLWTYVDSCVRIVHLGRLRCT
jgi:hypothetical protein